MININTLRNRVAVLKLEYQEAHNKLLRLKLLPKEGTGVERDVEIAEAAIALDSATQIFKYAQRNLHVAEQAMRQQAYRVKSLTPNGKLVRL